MGFYFQSLSRYGRPALKLVFLAPSDPGNLAKGKTLVAYLHPEAFCRHIAFRMSDYPHAFSSDEKKPVETADLETAPAVSTPRGYSAWFGGPNVTVGPRIGPVLKSITIVDSDSEDSSAILDKQFALEEGHAIKYRTCSWQKVRVYP